MKIFSKYFNKPIKERNPKTSFWGYISKVGEKEYEAIQMYFAGTRKWESGNKEEAIGFIIDAVILWPDNPNYHLAKGQYLFSMDQYDKASIDFEEYLSYGGEDAHAYEKLGRCLWNQNKYELAIKAFSAGIEILESSKADYEILYKDTNWNELVAQFYNNRANARLSIGTVEELNLGVRDCLESVRYAPKYATAYCTLGLLSIKSHESITVPYDNHLLQYGIEYLVRADELGNSNAVQILRQLNEKYNFT